MSQLVVGVADCRWSADPADVLVTYALGSCIAVAAYDPVSKAGGMLHFMLPDSQLDARKASQNPFMFADTGVPALIRGLSELGANSRRLTVRIAGGAQVLDTNGHFNIGKRNYLALRKVLWKAGLMIHRERVGGQVSRTVSLELASGRMHWREGNGRSGELPVNGGPTGAR